MHCVAEIKQNNKMEVLFMFSVMGLIKKSGGGGQMIWCPPPPTFKSGGDLSPLSPTCWRPCMWAISHNDPVHAVCWRFSTAELLRELTVHMLIIVHESSRFSSCSTEHLWIVSPQPRTPTRRQQSIDVYDHDSTCRYRRRRRESTNEVHSLYALHLWIFYAGYL